MSYVALGFACVIEGHSAVQQTSVHLSFVIFAVSTECCPSWLIVSDTCRWRRSGLLSDSHFPLFSTQTVVFADHLEVYTKQNMSFWCEGKSGWPLVIICRHAFMKRLAAFVYICLHCRHSPTFSKQKRDNSETTDTTFVNHSVWNDWQLRVVGCCNAFLCTTAIKPVGEKQCPEDFSRHSLT